MTQEPERKFTDDFPKMMIELAETVGVDTTAKVGHFANEAAELWERLVVLYHQNDLEEFFRICHSLDKRQVVGVMMFAIFRLDTK